MLSEVEPNSNKCQVPLHPPCLKMGPQGLEWEVEVWKEALFGPQVRLLPPTPHQQRALTF